MADAMSPRGQRVVLVIPRDGSGSKQGLSATLDEIARLGWVLVSVIDPARHLEALRMVLDGVADVVLADRPEHMPSVRIGLSLAPSQAGSRPPA